MKYLNKYEGFMDKMRDVYAEPVEMPTPEVSEIEGKKIGRIKDLEELEGRILYDPESETFLYVNHYDDLLELCDKDQRVIESSPVPKPGQIVPMEGYENDINEDGDPKTGVYMDESCGFIEWFLDGNVTNSFSLKGATDVSDIIDL